MSHTNNKEVEEAVDDYLAIINAHPGIDKRKQLIGVIHQELQKARESDREKLLAFTNQRADEQYNAVMGEAWLMRNKGYNDGMKAVATFIQSELDQPKTN